MIFKNENDNYRVTIEIDTDPTDPRDNDNLGIMLCNHKRYTLGDMKASNTDKYSSWQDWLKGELGDDVIALPLYLYDHSGLSMSTGGFNCPFDSGQVGYIYCRKEYFKSVTGITENIEHHAKQFLNNEVIEYNNYLTGDVYGFIIEKKTPCACCNHVEYDVIDSCFGFTGDTIKEDMSEYFDDEILELIKGW